MNFDKDFKMEVDGGTIWKPGCHKRKRDFFNLTKRSVYSEKGHAMHDMVICAGKKRICNNYHFKNTMNCKYWVVIPNSVV